METRKAASKSLATVSLSSGLGFLAARLAGYSAGNIDLYILLVLFGLFFANVIYLYWFDIVEDFFWLESKKRSLKKPFIAILNVPDCPRGSTRFTPDDWLQQVQRVTQNRTFRVALIEPREISGKYDAIINPYGEYYPENDLAEMTSLQNIKQYITGGGTFVNAGGLAFFYGYDRLRNRQATLGKELEGYRETYLPNNMRIFLPARLWPATYAFSLADTPLWNFFKVLTTLGDATTVRVFQDDEARRFCGDIQSIGGIDQVREFRAAREPLRNARPLLRARWPNEESNVEVYPLIAIPQNKGCLILGGMDLNSSIQIGGVDVDNSERAKVIEALVNLLENQRNGNIPFDWRKC